MSHNAQAFARLCCPGPLPRRVPASGLKRLSSHKRRLATNATALEGGLEDPAAYCRNLVRTRDHEGYLTSYFYPRHLQPAFFAWRALYVELASIQDTVSNTMIGRMRMQFWKDAVKGIFDDRPPKHPIALALHEVQAKMKLPAYHLRRVVDARDAELESPGHLTLDSLTAHAEATSSTSLYTLLSLLRLSSSSTLSHAASHLGVAQTIHVLLRALPYHASKGRMVIPAEITARHGVRQEDVFRRGGDAEGISDAVFEFASVANDNLLTAADMFRQEDKALAGRAMPVFLSGIPTRDFLERLEAVNFDAFHPSLQGRNWKVPLKIWRGQYRGTF